MEKTLYDKKGEAVAYIAIDYQEAVYLWDGQPVAYVYQENHLYGINGRHLGWFIDDILYDQEGARIGFTTSTCPAAVGKKGPKAKRAVVPELKPRWAAPPLPKLSFREAAQDLADFLREGRAL
jgi:4-fold beta flower protein